MKYVIISLVIAVVCSSAARNVESKLDEWDSRIVGGSEVRENAAPYHATLRNPNNTYFCGGAIITTRTILTAAQCLFGRTAATTMAYLGTNSLSSGGSRYQGYFIRIHNSYNQFTHDYDIGLLVVDRIITFGPSVGVLLPNPANVGTDVTVSLTGFGSISYPGEVSESLRIISLKTITTSDCQASLGVGADLIDGSRLCTFTRIGEGACEGDVGSPLVNDVGIVGIYIWGRPCAIGSPDVFTKIYTFYSWIQSNQVG